MSAARGRGQPPLAGRLDPLIRREIAGIGALITASSREEEPDYVWLFHTAKSSKQAAVEQMSTLIRSAGAKPAGSGGPIEPVLRLQTAIMQHVGTTATLRAMRLAEEELIARYREVDGEFEGLEARAMTRVMERAVKRWHLLTAHIARRNDGDVAEAERLPFPLERYMANETPHVCLRCSLDRPGRRPALEKSDPHPYTYVCAACHEETWADFPPDLREASVAWTESELHDRIIHKAQSRVEKLRADLEVHAILSGLEPERPEPATRRREVATRRAAVAHAKAPRQPLPILELDRASAAEDELAYSDMLFDFRSVRMNW